MGCAFAMVLAALAGQAPAANSARAPAEAPATQTRVSDSQLVPIIEAVERMSLALSKANDGTMIFYRREYKSGQLPQVISELKFRSKPRAFYLKTREGMEAIWREGINDNKLIAHPGSFPDITVSLKVDSWTAMRGNRHTIVQSGYHFLVGIIERDTRECQARPQCVVSAKTVGKREEYGAQSQCLDVTFDKRRCPDLYGERVVFCLREGLDLPTRLQVWNVEDGQLRLVEDYGYENIRINVGLTDADFDPKNYNF